MPPAFNLSQDQTLQFNSWLNSRLTWHKVKNFMFLYIVRVTSSFLASTANRAATSPKTKNPHLSIVLFLKSFARKTTAWLTCLPHQKVRKRILHQEKNVSTNIQLKINSNNRTPYIGCGGRTWTCDLRVMSPTSCQLLHPAPEKFHQSLEHMIGSTWIWNSKTFLYSRQSSISLLQDTSH